jgi:hypothetical protein
MIIDGVEYPDSSKEKPKTNISVKNFNLLLRMFVLMSLNIKPVLAKPLSLRRTANPNLVYNNFYDPSQPIPPYYSTIPSGWEMYNYPFVAHNSSSALVVSGDHTLAKKTYSGGHILLEENSCFDYEEIVKILQASIGNTSATSLVNYTQPPCLVSNYKYDNDGYRYNAQVYGLSENDCALFKNKYNARVGECHDDTLTLILLFSMLSGMGFVFIMVMMCCLVNDRSSNSSVDRNNNDRAPGFRNTLHAYSINSTVRKIKLSDTPGIDQNLKEYLKSIENSDIRLEKLNDEDRSALTTLKPDLCCPLSLELMDMPVLVGGNAFDFSSLLPLPASDGKRKHPLRAGEAYQFRLDQVQPAVEKRAAIINLIQEKQKPASEKTALLATASI